MIQSLTYEAKILGVDVSLHFTLKKNGRWLDRHKVTLECPLIEFSREILTPTLEMIHQEIEDELVSLIRDARGGKSQARADKALRVAKALGAIES